MDLCCDGERVYLSKDYRVKGFSKRDLLERGTLVKVWQSERLSETPGVLVNTHGYLIGAGASKLIRMDRGSGESVEIDMGNEIRDLTADFREVFFVTAEGLYRLSVERFAAAEAFRFPVSDLMDRPLRSVALLGENLFVLGGSFLYRLSLRGEKLAEKALAEGLRVLPHREGAVVIARGKIIYTTEDLEVLASADYRGNYVKAEHRRSCSETAIRR